jgi:VWFA-related protein
VLKNKKAGATSSKLLDPEADKLEDFEIDDMAHVPMIPAQVVADARQFQADTRAADTDQRVAMTVEALQDLARYLSGIPGRKNLIWFSGSFPIALDPDVTLDDPSRAVRNYAAQIRETTDLLSAARVAVYPVDARGLISLPSSDVSTMSTSGMRPTSTVAMGAADAQAVRELGPERGAMQAIAAATGGREFNNTNGLKEAVADAVENGSSYYTIGYVPAVKQLDGQFRKLQVKVDGGKYKLAYRNGYYADPPDKPTEHTLVKSSLMLDAILKGAPAATQILFQMRVLKGSDPLLVDANLPAGPLGELAAGLKGPLQRTVVDLKVDPRGFAYEETPDEARHASAEFTLVAYGGDGLRVNYSDHSIPLNLKKEQYMEILKTGLPVRLALDLPAGGYALRVAVRDRVTGRIGSLEVPLAVAGK